MKRFKYNYLQNTLAYQPIHESPNDFWYHIPEDKQFIRFNSQGFILDPPNHWITFTIYEEKIKVFYKQVKESSRLDNLDEFWESQQITYYRQYFPKQETLIFELNFADKVEKIAGKWVKKRTSS